MIKIAFLFRKQVDGFYSIEELFKTILLNLPTDFIISVKEMPFQSNNFIKRILNFSVAPFCQKDINHITGDVHYISIFLNKKKKTILTIHHLEIINRNSSFKRAALLFFWYWLPARRVDVITNL